MDQYKSPLDLIFFTSTQNHTVVLKVLTHEFETKIVVLKVPQGYYRIPENPKNWT